MKAIVSLCLGLQLAVFSAHAAVPTRLQLSPPRRRKLWTKLRVWRLS